MFAILCCSAVLGYGSSSVVPSERLYKLDIIHYNDFHARFEETSVDSPTCRYNNNSCLGGFARLYYEIHTLLQEKPDSLVLNAGDSFQGTYWYTLLKWNITQEFMNLIPHDAHALGNHEFDDGPEGLVPYMRALKAPVLVANMDTSEEPSFQGLYKPHIVVHRKGRKIGIIGLITASTETLSAPGKVKFTNAKEATRREVQALKKKGVDIIILLTHCGIDEDREIAREVGEHVDIIVGGHSHSLFWNGPSPSGEPVDAPYPLFVESSKNNKHQVLIVQASAYTKYMGNLSVYFDYKGDYVKWEGGPIFLNRSIPEDAAIKARLEPYAKLVHKAENMPVGNTTHAMKLEDCDHGECTLGDLLADALYEFASNATAGDHQLLTFMQRGNIRTTIVEKVITEATICALFPYDDQIRTYELQGKYVRQALERSVAQKWDNEHPGPWILDVSGLQVTYNVSRPEGDRITSVNVSSKGSNTPLDNNETYLVVSPTFMTEDFGGFEMIKQHKRNARVIGHDQDILRQYIKRHSPLNIKTDDRIVI